MIRGNMWKHKNFINLQLCGIGEPVSGIRIFVNGDAVVLSDSAGSTWQDIDYYNSEYTIEGNTVVWNDGTILQYNSVDILPTANIISDGQYTTRAAASTPTFKHFYDAGLQGTGTIKFRHYSQTEPSSGETWVLNDEPSITTSFTTDINFVSNGQEFSKFGLAVSEPILHVIGYGYYVNGSYEQITAYNKEDAGWSNSAYKTITFSTAPTGDLLTWLQANGTKQGGATEHTLTFDSAIEVKVNGTLVTSPYTLQNNDEIVLIHDTSYLIVNGVSYTTSGQTISLSDTDIVVERGSRLPGGFSLTINYTTGGGAVTEYTLSYTVETGITYNIFDEDGVLLVAEEVSDSSTQRTLTSSSPIVTIKQISIGGFGITAYGNTENCTVVVKENDKAVITMTETAASVEIQTGIV